MNKEEIAFHKSRKMFYVWNDEVIVAPDNDKRGHKEFINNDYIYNNCIRGYYLLNLVLYTDGDNFDSISDKDYTKWLKILVDKFNIPKYTYVWNGVIKGEPGELWSPIKVSFV